MPVVASRVGGLPHAISDDHSGFLVDGWDPAHYAAAVRLILNDPERAARMSDGAVEYASEFSWQATADRLLELYEGITGQ